MEIPQGTAYDLRERSRRIASRLSQEPLGEEKLNGFVCIATAMAREIWGGPETMVADTSLIDDVTVEIEEIAILMDTILHPVSVFVAFLLSLRLIFIGSFSVLDILVFTTQ